MNNATIFQFFHWYNAGEHGLWQQGREEAGKLAALGITHAWLPPEHILEHSLQQPVMASAGPAELEQEHQAPVPGNAGEIYTQCVEAFRENGMLVLSDEALAYKTGIGEKMNAVHSDITNEAGAPDDLLTHIRLAGGLMKLLDVPLHYSLHEASINKQYDLRTLFENTIIKNRPGLAITFVDNHDTQPLQALESFVQPWFQQIAYAIILLRLEGIPCVFYPSLYGARYVAMQQDTEALVELAPVAGIEVLMRARRELAYGVQVDHWDDAHLVGWARCGVAEKPGSGCAVLISTAGEGTKKMNLGKENVFRTFKDITGNHPGTVMLDENGEGAFHAAPCAVSVWADENWNAGGTIFL